MSILRWKFCIRVIKMCSWHTIFEYKHWSYESFSDKILLFILPKIVLKTPPLYIFAMRSLQWKFCLRQWWKYLHGTFSCVNPGVLSPWGWNFCWLNTPHHTFSIINPGLMSALKWRVCCRQWFRCLQCTVFSLSPGLMSHLGRMNICDWNVPIAHNFCVQAQKLQAL